MTIRDFYLILRDSKAFPQIALYQLWDDLHELEWKVGWPPKPKRTWDEYRDYDILINWTQKVLNLEARSAAERKAGGSSKDGKQPAVHSEDFTSVRWFGTDYIFHIGNQAKAIEVLWEHWERGGLAVHEKTIGGKIADGNNNFRLAHVFRKHRAWQTMIQTVVGKGGQYRLVPPSGIPE